MQLAPGYNATAVDADGNCRDIFQVRRDFLKNCAGVDDESKKSHYEGEICEHGGCNKYLCM